MAYDLNIREEEIKNRLRKDFFHEYNAEEVLGDIDFAVAVPVDGPQLFEPEYLLWAEAKKSNHHDIYESIVQLILTIGKARTFDKHLPPAFLGAFDAEKIAFISYNAVLDIFFMNDFNWNVTPSDHTTKEFKLVMSTVKDTLEKEMFLFRLGKDDKEIRLFIKRNFIVGKSKVSKIRINKTNFTAIFQKWLQEVKPTIANVLWDVAKKKGIIDADFYLADILSEHNVTLKEKLFVLLRKDHYELDRKIDDTGLFDSKKAEFKDNQKAHTQFWNRYDRPPKREYWDHIVARRDLLVAQDIREIKGSFFTPSKWVNLSQQYLAEEFGENWQDEYYIWDCAAGTGNLLANLTNKYRVWASTLDKADVDVMHDRIKTMNEASANGRDGANLLDDHVFQFDFLNDSFDNLPKKLQEIISDEEERKKLIVYINPPYAEASNKRTVSGSGKNRAGLSDTYVSSKYRNILRKSVNELYAHFLIRIYKEIPGAYIANFSSLKLVQAPNFRDFRENFRARMCRSFVVPAKTFDNVDSDFPIGFYIWNTQKNDEVFQQNTSNVHDADEVLLGKKNIYSYQYDRLVIDWLRCYFDKSDRPVGYQILIGTDIQHNNGVYISNWVRPNDIKKHMFTPITRQNLVPMVIYTAIRSCVDCQWINNKDLYLWPQDSWLDDETFQSDCLAYCLFNNNVESPKGDNNWIPFSESEVDSREMFSSHFMNDFIMGRTAQNGGSGLFGSSGVPALARRNEPIEFSMEAQAVMEAGRNLWRYYHQQPDVNPDAAFYDIRLYFQGTSVNKKGKEVMNKDSQDETYTQLVTDLRKKMRHLAVRIEAKVYEHGFLKRNYDRL